MTGVRLSSRRPLHRGFTLIEAVACITILSVLCMVSSGLILSAIESLLDSSTASQLHNELSIALDRVAGEVRKIELDALAAGVGPDIDNVTAASLAWTDSDSDAYSLSLSGSDVMLAVDGRPAAILLSDVTALDIDTFDESNAALAASLAGVACDPIRRVKVSVTMVREGVTQSLSLRVFIRSTMAGA